MFYSGSSQIVLLTNYNITKSISNVKIYTKDIYKLQIRDR